MKHDTLRHISFSPPDLTEQEIQAVGEVIRSGWITTGPKTKELERRLADFVGADRCACLSSQTACAEMTLRLLGIGSLSSSLDDRAGSEEDEVITCAYTYTASASVVVHAGARLVLVDCRKDDCEIDYDAIEAAVNEHTKAIIPVDLGGVPCDYDRLFDIVERKRGLFRPSNIIQQAMGRIAVISDSAHALGAEVRFRGEMRPVGSVADFSNFSFHAVKNLTTAEGGAVTWKKIDGISSDDIYKRLMLFSLHGQNVDALDKSRSGHWEYDIVGLWYKCNMTDIAASIGIAQLDRYPGLLARRREIVEQYDAAFKPLGVRPLEHFTADRVSSGHLYICRLPGLSRKETDEIMAELARRGIGTNVHYKPLPMHTAYKRLGFDISDFPNAYEYFSNEITLPLHTKLSDEDVSYVIDNLTDVIGK